jgi:hypothetical protein
MDEVVQYSFIVVVELARQARAPKCMGMGKLSGRGILCNFIQFGGHMSRTPCAAMNFGLGHGSRHPVPNVKCVTPGPNLPRRCKKGRIFEIFCLVCRIFGSVTPNFVGCRSAKSVFWVTGHNPCRIERNCAVDSERSVAGAEGLSKTGDGALEEERWGARATGGSKGLAKKIIKHIMPNFVFKLWPGGPTDHGNHQVMASFPVRLFLTWFNWCMGHKFHRFCVIYLAQV